jgi:hypothetical protein
MSRLDGWARPYCDQIFVPRWTPTSAVRLDGPSRFQLRKLPMRPGQHEVLVFIDQVHVHFPVFTSLCSFGTGSAFSTVESPCYSEVRMRFIRVGTAKTSADVMSGILNCVCPECGGSMGRIGREFKCQGECQTDWRQIWDQVLSGGNWRTTNAIRST